MSGDVGATLDAVGVQRWIRRFVADFAVERERLTELDRRSGDGDFGTNLAAALRKVVRNLDALEGSAGPRGVLDAVSLAFLDTGGTSGPLFGMFFRDLSRAQDADVMTSASLAAGVAAGTATVQRLGGARVGDKTMVDALAPAVAALEAAAGEGVGVADALARAGAAAREGSASTAALLARRGRASYVGDVARGVLDPGAETVALLLGAGVPDGDASASAV